MSWSSTTPGPFFHFEQSLRRSEPSPRAGAKPSTPKAQLEPYHRTAPSTPTTPSRLYRGDSSRFATDSIIDNLVESPYRVSSPRVRPFNGSGHAMDVSRRDEAKVHQLNSAVDSLRSTHSDETGSPYLTMSPMSRGRAVAKCYPYNGTGLPTGDNFLTATPKVAQSPRQLRELSPRARQNIPLKAHRDVSPRMAQDTAFTSRDGEYAMAPPPTLHMPLYGHQISQSQPQPMYQQFQAPPQMMPSQMYNTMQMPMQMPMQMGTPVYMPQPPPMVTHMPSSYPMTVPVQTPISMQQSLSLPVDEAASVTQSATQQQQEYTVLDLAPGPLEYIELVDETLKVLHEMLRTWSAATETAIGVRANLELPPSPPQVEYMSPSWKLPVEIPALPHTRSAVPEKAKFLQEAITMLMIFLDEINAQGDEYIRQARKMVLLRLEAVSTGAEAWVREYERVAKIVQSKAMSNRGRGSRRHSGRTESVVEHKSRGGDGTVTEYTRDGYDDGDAYSDDCSCSECEDERNNIIVADGRDRK